MLKVIHICMAALLTLASFHRAAYGNSGSFTVTDSIKMVRFGGAYQEAEPQVSPDGKYAAVVTSKGLLASNQIESTLWVFDTEDVRRFLRQTSGTAKPPAPKQVAQLSATPGTLFLDNYVSIISNVQWLPDSRTVIFLGQGGDGKSYWHKLYKADIAAPALQAITSDQYDVNRAVASGDSIVFTQAASQPSTTKVPPGEAINSSATDVTGRSLMFILFHDSPQLGTNFDAFFDRYRALWVKSGSNTSMQVQLVNSVTGSPVHILNHFPDILSVSPDAKFAVILMAVENMPPSWGDYAGYFGATFKAGDPATTSQRNLLRPVEYGLVSLGTGSVTPLVSGPLGWSLGHSNANEVIWSRDSESLMVTNVFLPLDGVDQSERERRRQKPCVAVVIHAASGNFSCVAFSLASAHKKAGLKNASFGNTEQDVVLETWRANEKPITEEFHNENSKWALVPPGEEVYQSKVNHHPQDAISGGMSFEIRQALNEPPELWARENATGVNKRLWNPNLPLSTINLGEASIVHWTDNSGHQWVAGLVKPPSYSSEKRFPLVIQTHGFDEDEFMTDGAYSSMFSARALAASGIVVLQMPINKAHQTELSEIPDQIEGFASAIKYLSSVKLIDPARVGIIGFSRTCLHAEGALINRPGLFTAAAIGDGVDESYLSYLFYADPEQGSSQPEAEKMWGGRPFGSGLKKWFDRAPGFNLGKVKAPLLIQAFGRDSILGEWEIYSSLRNQRKPVDLLWVPDGQHILQQPLQRAASQQYNVDWFRFWLQGYEDPDQAKDRQYQRWEELCDMQNAEKYGRQTLCVATKR